MIAIVAALEQELGPLRRRLATRPGEGATGLHLCCGELGGKALLLERTGLGPAHAQTAVASLLEQHELKAILSIGFAGAVRPDLRRGDLIIASQVHAAPERPDKEPPVLPDGLECDPGLVELAVATAEQQGLAFQLGRSLTVPTTVTDRPTKERLGHRWPTAVVEMESYWIGRVAAGQAIPFLTVRAVSDTLGDTLPDFGGVLDAGRGFHAAADIHRPRPYSLHRQRDIVRVKPA